MTSSLKDLLGSDDYEQLKLNSVLTKADKGEFMPPLHTWLKQVNPEFNWDWKYMKYMIDHLQMLSDGKIRKLMVSMPPRSGKSELCSIHFPAYFLEKDPNNRVIVGTYNQTLSSKLSRRIRALARDRVKLDPERKAMEEWNTAEGGGVRAVGVGAGIAGVGANLIILDDIVRSRKDANSITVRNTTYDWYTDDIYTRMEPDSRILVVGCIRGSSRVLMSDGTYKPIEDISVGDEVISWNAEKKIFEKDTVKNHGLSKYAYTYSVKTQAGTVYATSEHPFLTSQGYKKLEDLEIGDEIVTPSLINIDRQEIPKMFNGEDITKEFLWWLGFMFGDGWNTSWRKNNYDKIRNKTYKSRAWAVCFAAGIDENINEKVANMFETFFERKPKYKAKEGYYRVDFNALGRYLEEIGFSHKYSAKTKRLPSWIFSLSAEEKREFLRGFLEADGWVDNRTPSERYRTQISNEGLLLDLRQVAETCSVRTTCVYERTRIIQPPNSPKPILSTTYDCGFTFEDNGEESCHRHSKIKEISLGVYEPVYDIEVEKNHNYVVEGMVVSNTRWNEVDIIGRLERADQDLNEWTIINIQAIAEENDVLGRKVGEALNPERYPIEKLLEIKRVMGRSFNALFQGRPTEQEGEFFKASWFRAHTFKSLPKSTEQDKKRYEFIRFWDKASSTDGDYTVGILMAKERLSGTYYILDMVRGKWLTHKRDKIILETAIRDATTWKDYGTVKIRHEQEPGSAGKDAAKHTNKMLAGFPVKAIRSTGSKRTRAEPYADQCAAGNIFLMESSWMETFIDEHAVFDNGTNDDIVDASSGAFAELSRGSSFISFN